MVLNILFGNETLFLARVTIQDVAKRATVSISTVSRVLNNNDTVAEDLRERVLQAISELGYEPDRAAQRLRSRKSDVLGLIVADIQNPHFVSVIQGVQDAAYRNGMNIILCDTDESPGRFSENVHVLQAESVAGLIVVPTPSGNADALRSIQKDNVPVVVLDRAVDGVAIDTVMADNTAGAQAAVKHLIDLGRRRIAGIFPDVQTGDERRDGYVQAHLDAGLGQPAKELILTGSYRSKGSYEVALNLFRNQDVDAVFTATNFVTLGVIRAIRELGIAVPQDIALVGFDDMPWADELFIPYTAIAQPTYQIGQTAVELLIDRINNRDRAPRRVKMPVELIIRASCGAQGPPNS